MSIEFWCLLGAMTLGLIHLTFASFAFKRQVGNAYTMGARDGGLQPNGIAGRLARAQSNFLETFPIFVAAVLMVHFLGRENGLSSTGALLYIAGRSAYLPLYALGIPIVRSLAWKVATLGLVLVMIRIAL